MVYNRHFLKFSGLNQQLFIWLRSLPSGAGLARMAHLCSTWHPFGGWDRRWESPGGVTHLSGGDSNSWGWTAGALGHLLFSLFVWSHWCGDFLHVHLGLPKPTLRQREKESREGCRTKLQPYHLLWPVLGNYAASLALNFNWSVQSQSRTSFHGEETWILIWSVHITV